jgi:hypothetical protein
LSSAADVSRLTTRETTGAVLRILDLYFIRRGSVAEKRLAKLLDIIHIHPGVLRSLVVPVIEVHVRLVVSHD